MPEPWKCPSCGEMTVKHPALSRKDNKTYICPLCGIKEALDDFVGFIAQHK